MNAKGKHLVFYSDVAYFGGHEKMTVEIIRTLARAPGISVTAIAYAGNARLLEALRAAGQAVRILPVPYASKATGWLRLPFETPQAWRLSRIFRSLRPDYLILFAGNIDSCLKGIYGARLAGFPVIMYLPQAHKASLLGSKLGKRRDGIQDFFYRRVDFWITISRSMAEVLATHGIDPSAIRVVYNGIDTSILRPIAKAEARARLGLPQDAFLIANVGRIDFYVKNQGLVVEALRRRPEAFAGAVVAFVGEGPDEAELARRIEEGGLAGRARIVPWQTDVSLIYSALDMLLIASRIEGMPLVMLEAMHYGLPIVSTAVDGMREILPGEWLFPSGDPEALAATVDRVRRSYTRGAIEALRAMVPEKFGLERMGADFLAALEEAPPCSRA